MKARGSVACADSGNAPLFVSTVRSGTHWPLPAGWEMLVVTCALGPGGSAENNLFLLCPSLPPLSAPLTLTEVNPSTAAKISQRSHPASQARLVLIWPPSERLLSSGLPVRMVPGIWYQAPGGTYAAWTCSSGFYWSDSFSFHNLS